MMLQYIALMIQFVFVVQFGYFLGQKYVKIHKTVY